MTRNILRHATLSIIFVLQLCIYSSLSEDFDFMQVGIVVFSATFRIFDVVLKVLCYSEMLKFPLSSNKHDSPSQKLK